MRFRCVDQPIASATGWLRGRTLRTQAISEPWYLKVPVSKRCASSRKPRCNVKTLLVVYHSATGGTRQMAEAAANAAADPEITVRLLSARDANAEDVVTADGYIFASPENLAALAGVMKDFFDRTYYAALERING